MSVPVLSVAPRHVAGLSLFAALTLAACKKDDAEAAPIATSAQAVSTTPVMQLSLIHI